jgi:hypothetical protein
VRVRASSGFDVGNEAMRTVAQLEDMEMTTQKTLEP